MLPILFIRVAGPAELEPNKQAFFLEWIKGWRRSSKFPETYIPRDMAANHLFVVVVLHKDNCETR